jgi:hypothetical protein
VADALSESEAPGISRPTQVEKTSLETGVRRGEELRVFPRSAWILAGGNCDSCVKLYVAPRSG